MFYGSEQVVWAVDGQGEIVCALCGQGESLPPLLPFHFRFIDMGICFCRRVGLVLGLFKVCMHCFAKECLEAGY